MPEPQGLFWVARELEQARFRARMAEAELQRFRMTTALYLTTGSSLARLTLQLACGLPTDKPQEISPCV